MSYQINICDLALDQLNGASLARIGQFIQKLEEINGSIVEFSDAELIGKIVQHAKQTDNAELKRLYGSIKTEIKKYLNSEDFKQFDKQFSEKSAHRSVARRMSRQAEQET